MNVIQTMLKDYYEIIEYDLKSRPVVMENIEKVINCGAKYSNDRSTAMSFKLINCTHRHLVFTIDESLRHFFLENRDLLNCLFEAVSDVIKALFFSLNKSKNFVPGFICVNGLYARHRDIDDKLHKAVHKSKHKIILDLNTWRKRFLPTMGYDPLQCPNCKKNRPHIFMGSV